MHARFCTQKSITAFVYKIALVNTLKTHYYTLPNTHINVPVLHSSRAAHSSLHRLLRRATHEWSWTSRCHRLTHTLSLSLPRSPSPSLTHSLASTLLFFLLHLLLFFGVYVGYYNSPKSLVNRFCKIKKSSPLDKSGSIFLVPGNKTKTRIIEGI